METLINMEKVYRLEFNEQQQCFHYANPKDIENTFGWFTVCYCTDIEYYILKSYLNSKSYKKYNKEILIQSVSELKSFIDNLTKNNLIIRKI